MRTPQIHNLLFDQGGVIIDLDRQRCLDALAQLGLPHPERLVGLYEQSGPFSLLESGAISPAEFRDRVRRMFAEHVTDEQIDKAFCSFIVGIPLSRLRALRELKKTYRTFILSNTNPIMMHSVIRENFEQEGLTIHDYFDGVALSYEAGYNKPHPGIFEYAIAHLGIDPCETLFLDDGEANLVAAARFGFHTALVPPGGEFEEIIKKHLGL